MSEKNKYLAFSILIGGKSTRFGTDKGLFKFKGKPLISYQLETLSRFNHDIFLVANSQHQIQNYINEIDITKIMAFILDDKDIILDQNVRSPILGLYSTFKELKKLTYQKVFVFSCDNPLFSYEVVDYMIKECGQYDCYMPKWNNGFREPLFAIYPVEKAYKTSLRNLKQKQYKLTKIIGEDWTVKYVSIEQNIKNFDPNLLSFKNINKPGDIKTLESVSDKNL